MREFVITDASMPRLDSALLAQYPQLSPGRLHKYLCEYSCRMRNPERQGLKDLKRLEMA